MIDEERIAQQFRWFIKADDGIRESPLVPSPAPQNPCVVLETVQASGDSELAELPAQGTVWLGL